jgi:hypothetical protein
MNRKTSEELKECANATNESNTHAADYAFKQESSIDELSSTITSSFHEHYGRIASKSSEATPYNASISFQDYCFRQYP